VWKFSHVSGNPTLLAKRRSWRLILPTVSQERLAELIFHVNAPVTIAG